MKGLPKFLIEAVPGIENIKDKAVERERSVCPECESVVIIYRSRTHDYVCERCFAVFKHPKRIMMYHDDGFCINPTQHEHWKGGREKDV